jgi:tRNA A37 threonylcarbamoyladenosine synthetase subunit TsaC/SUA5/YrdC
VAKATSTRQGLEPTTIILDCIKLKGHALKSLVVNKKDNSIAFRVPGMLDLRKFLLQTGPLVALSANPQNLTPAKNIIEAKNYFSKGNLGFPVALSWDIDFYLDGGIMEGKASQIIRLFSDGSVEIIRN